MRQLRPAYSIWRSTSLAVSLSSAGCVQETSSATPALPAIRSPTTLHRWTRTQRAPRDWAVATASRTGIASIGPLTLGGSVAAIVI